jgi:plasmid stability protein
MAQFVVRNVDDSVKTRLKRRARRNGHSMEEEIRDILRDAVKEESDSGRGLGTEISALFSRVGIESDIPELRGYAIKPVNFDK